MICFHFLLLIKNDEFLGIRNLNRITIMFEYFTLEQADQWEEIVKSFKNYDVYYLPGYVKAFEINGDGKACLLYYTNNSCRAINVVMLRDISKEYGLYLDNINSPLYDITTPYGYGGFIIEGDKYDSLKNEYIEFAKKIGIVSEFVRFHPVTKNYNTIPNLYEEIHLGETVCINTEDKSQIWKNYTSKNRNTIRKAIKSGVKVFWGRDISLIKPFIEIYTATMKKDNATDYYYFKQDFFESILEDLKYNSLWFYAIKNEKIIAMSIFMFSNGKMHYHLSASLKEYQHLAPTNLIINEAAMWANSNGIKALHLGGGLGSGQDSLYKFKKAFNRGDDTHFYIGKMIFNESAYQKLVELRKDSIINHNFFPEYRG